MAVVARTKIRILFIAFVTVLAPKTITKQCERDRLLLIFPVRSHSFLAAYRVFGNVEKVLREYPVLTTKEEYTNIQLYSQVQVRTVGILGEHRKLWVVKMPQNVYKNAWCSGPENKSFNLNKIYYHHHHM